MKMSGLNFNLQEFEVAELQNQWETTSKGKCAFELTAEEYGDFMESQATLAVYPNGFAFNYHLLPSSLMERMKENIVS